MWTLRVNWMWGGVMWTVQVAESEEGRQFSNLDMLLLRRKLAINEALARLQDQIDSQMEGQGYLR